MATRNGVYGRGFDHVNGGFKDIIILGTAYTAREVVEAVKARVVAVPAGRLSAKARQATIAMVKTLAADLSTDTGHFAQTVASLQQHLQTLAADRAEMQGFGVKDRAGRKS